MISNRERWHVEIFKKISTLLRGITSKHDKRFLLFELSSFRTNTNINYMKKYVKIKIFVVLECLLKTLRY